MNRVAIIGCGGSGKSTLARRLAATLDAPLTHLDAIYYDRHWRPMPQEEFAARQRALVAAPRWVIEGNYASTLPVRLAAADTVIFLDLSTAVCLWGIVQRRLRHGGEQHRINWAFIRYVVGYRCAMRPRVLELIREHGSHVDLITVRSRREANRLAGGRPPRAG